MKALVYEGNRQVAVRELEDPRPASGEVVIEVAAAGVCGTDRHIVAGELGVRPGTVLGHEICGRIAERGAGVDRWSVGDRVVSYGQAVCGECSACTAGHQNRCVRAEPLGLARPGGFAERVAVPAAGLLAAPPEVESDAAAVATDAIATPFHALTSVARLTAGENVIVVGCGGLGLYAIQLARLAGAGRLVAVDPSPHARAAALEAGADSALDPTSVENPGRALRAAGATLALEFVGRAESVEQALEALAPGGRLVIVGVGHDRPRLPPLVRFIGLELEVRGAFGSTIAEIETVLRLIASGRLDASRFIRRRVSLSSAPALFTEASGCGRTVIVPSLRS